MNQGIKYFPALILTLGFLFPFFLFGEDLPTFDIDSLVYSSNQIFLGRVVTPSNQALLGHVATVSVLLPIIGDYKVSTEIPVSLCSYSVMNFPQTASPPDDWWQTQEFLFFLSPEKENIGSISYFSPVSSGLLLKTQYGYNHPIQFMNPGPYVFVATSSHEFSMSPLFITSLLPGIWERVLKIKTLLNNRSHNLYDFRLIQTLVERLSIFPVKGYDNIREQVCQLLARRHPMARIRGLTIMRIFEAFNSQIGLEKAQYNNFDWPERLLLGSFQTGGDAQYLLYGLLASETSEIERPVFSIAFREASNRFIFKMDEESFSPSPKTVLTYIASEFREKGCKKCLINELLRFLPEYFKQVGVNIRRFPSELADLISSLRKLASDDKVLQNKKILSLISIISSKE